MFAGDSIDDMDDVFEDRLAIEKLLKAPGAYEELDSRVTEVTTLDRYMKQGISISIPNYLSIPTQEKANDPFLQLLHTFELGKKEGINPFTRAKDGERSSYSFTTFFQRKPWIIQSMWSRAITMLVLVWNTVVDAKLLVQMSGDPTKNTIEPSVAYTRGNWHGLLKLHGGAPLLQYTQTIAKGWALGTELLYAPTSDGTLAKHAVTLRHQNIIHKERAKDNEHVSTSVISIETASTSSSQFAEQPQALGLSHVQSIDKGLDFVTSLNVEYHANKKKWDPKLMFGYNYKLDDGGGGVQATSLINITEKKLLTSVQGITDIGKVGLDTKIDYASNNYDIGISFSF